MKLASAVPENPTKLSRPGMSSGAGAPVSALSAPAADEAANAGSAAVPIASAKTAARTADDVLRSDFTAKTIAQGSHAMVFAA